MHLIDCLIIRARGHFTPVHCKDDIDQSEQESTTNIDQSLNSINICLRGITSNMIQVLTQMAPPYMAKPLLILKIIVLSAYKRI